MSFRGTGKMGKNNVTGGNLTAPVCHVNKADELANPGYTKGGSITVLLTFCLTGSESAV